MVLLAPSWHGPQLLIDTLYVLEDETSMSFNTSKTICMVFNPSVSRKIVSHNFPVFTVGNTALKFVSKFKYLGNIITDDLKDDARCNIVIIRLKYCSWYVKVKFCQARCLCLYNPGLWQSFNKA